MAVNFMLHHANGFLLLLVSWTVIWSLVHSETSTGYYECLHVQPTAAASEIKRAYRLLAIKYHPDKNKSVGAQKKFLEISEAHRVLSNQKRRRLYDSLANKDVLKEPSWAEPDVTSFTLSDIFRETDESMNDQFYWSDFHYGDDNHNEESLFF